MVRDGKISRGALERVRRMENAHANSVEGYAVFVAGVVSFLSFIRFLLAVVASCGFSL